ncbi:MAG: hypothetical protein OEQ74_09420, partial [Gammaproteobacteria bacterium]|nr:hypothetical protein [Gammaproteobacteria bacterium]
MSSEPRIAHLNLAREFRGGERQTLALIRALDGRVRQTAIVHRAAPLADQLSGLDVRIEAVGGSPLAAVAGTRGFDLLHVHEGRSPQTAALRWLLSRTPFIVTRRIPQAPSVTALWCYRRARRIVAVSDAIAETLRSCDSRLSLSTVHDCTPELEADPAAVAGIRGTAQLVIGQCGALHDA